MRRMRVLVLRLRSIFLARRADRELASELQFHLEQQIEENLARGMNAMEARDAARRTIGGIVQLKEECRDMRRVNWIEHLIADLRYAVRVLIKNPGFLAVAVLTLALAVGANAAIFSVINAVLLSPLPYPDADRLVMVKELFPVIGPTPISVSGPDILQIQKTNRVFDAVGGFRVWSFELSGPGEPEQIIANRASSDLFKTLGAQPLIGRVFTSEEETPGHAVAVLSYALWQRRFGSDRGVVGRTVDLDRRPYVVIGVMPPNFVFPLPGMLQGRAADLWVPLALTKEELADIADSFDYTVIAKMKTGVAGPELAADLPRMASAILESYKQAAGNKFVALRLELAAQSLNEQVRGPVHGMLWMLLGSVGFVLLIACVNVANLLLTRAAGRDKEMAVRLAMGAGRFRLLRQLLAEGMVVASAGGLAGLGAAVWMERALISILPPNVPRFRPIELDGRVLAFTFLLVTITGLLFGVLPALSASRTDLNHTLKESGRGAIRGPAHPRLRATFVVVEIALSVTLLIGAGLLIRSFERVLSTNPGFRPEHVLTASLNLPSTEYRDDAKVAMFYRQLIERLSHTPGVIAAGASSDLPIEGAWTHLFSPEGYQPPAGAGGNLSNHSVIYGDYLQSMGIPLLRGRYFTDQDRADSPPVLIVSESLAKKYWPSQDPLGKRLKWGPPESTDPWITVVGVAGDVKQGPLDRATVPHTYQPYAQLGALRSLHVAIRGEGDAANLAAAVRAAVWSLDRQLAVPPMRTMEQVISHSTAARRFNLFLLGSFAAVALLLAAIGIYGVLAYSVAQRTHEIGVRLALGATGGDVVGLVLRQGFQMIAAGVIVGAAGALALTRVLEGLLFEVRPTDPMTFGLVPLLLALVALAASYVPARRAIRVEPAIALRHE